MCRSASYSIRACHGGAQGLDESKIDPQQLTLEVTESLYSEDSAERTEVLSELRRIGVKIAIDDFGTGYSALSSLRDMPVDVLKIDKSFVDHIADSAEAAHLVQMILQLAHDFRISTVAEGAENVRQVQMLRAMGCSFVQGYYFSKPLPESELEIVLQRDFPVPPPLKPTAGGYDRRVSNTHTRPLDPTRVRLHVGIVQ